MQVLSGQQAAELLSVTTRRLYQIAKEADPPPKDSSGIYPAREFGQWLRDRHVVSLGIQDNGEVLDLNAERARLAKEQDDKTAMDNARLRGELVPVAAARELLEKILSTFKTRILSIPAKLAPLMVGLKSITEARDLVYDHLVGALNELSRLNVSELTSRGSVSGSKATAKTNSKPVGRRASKAKS